MKTPRAKRPQPGPRDYEVFISYKNTGADGKPTVDAGWARKVYEALKAMGIRAFFSEQELPRLGKAHFAPALEKALESSRVLVLIASSRDHIESSWVRAEWGGFQTLLRNGKEGELFILNCGRMAPRDLPLFLQETQMVPVEELRRLLEFVKNALPRRVRLQDYVRFSLHCYRPKKGEKGEDKIYLVTIREDESGHQVKAHWGPRAARRLNSQLKGVGIQDKAVAEKLADDLRQEKERTGYQAKPLKGLVTRQAWQALEADLGLHAEGGVRGHAKPTGKSGQAPAGEHDYSPLFAELRRALVKTFQALREVDSHRADQLAREISRSPGLSFLPKELGTGG